jgi:hypothetical protein
MWLERKKREHAAARQELSLARYLCNHIVDERIELIGAGVLERGRHVFPVLPEAGLSNT